VTLRAVEGVGKSIPTNVLADTVYLGVVSGGRSGPKSRPDSPNPGGRVAKVASGADFHS